MLKISLNIFILFFSTNAFSTLEYSKVDLPGCPENAYCQKNTGEVRKIWLDNLDKLNTDKISEAKLNSELQNSYGIPVAGWAMEEAGVLPRIMMWDSPCKQHKKEASKFYISELFRKNLRESELKEFTNIYFPRAIGLDSSNKPYSMIIPRGDIPTYVENGNLYFLKEDEGKYYGMLLNRQGEIVITKAKTIKEIPREVVCKKEQIDLFMREAPSPTFYQSYNCKEIWDKSSKSYKPMLFGWSCN
jgi:hypothetical protein